jgi:hypothetical protein
MTDHELNRVPTDEAAPPATEQPLANGHVAPAEEATPTVEGVKTEEMNEVATDLWRAEAGRKGARRVHQLIQEGLQYEKEHGLKSGRQRLRQLIELGKVYEKEHGVQAEQPKKRRQRLARMEREQLLTTLLDCLLRIAKPSFRAELEQLVEVLRAGEEGHAA